MSLLPLNFPVFYHCVVKSNTILPQYDAVSVLLTGMRRDEEPEDLQENMSKIRISDADAANYISGKKSIKREILERVPELTFQDAVSRLSALGFQDVGKIRSALIRLLNITELSPEILKKLLADDSNNELALVANVLLMALRYPSKKLRPLTVVDKNQIASCYTDEIKKKPDEAKSESSNESDVDALKMATFLSQEELEQFSQLILGSEEELNQFLQAHPPQKVPDYMKGLNHQTISIRKITKKVQNSPEMHEKYIPCTLFMGDQTASALSELTNVVLSAGISALHNILEETFRIDLPQFGYYDDFSTLKQLLFCDESDRIIHSFSGENIHGTPVCGYLVVCADHDFLQKYYEQHKKDYPSKFISYTEALEYEASVYQELGSIFSGASTTVLANYLDSRIVIEATNIRNFEVLFDGRNPIFAGKMPFLIDDTHFCAYLLLDYLSAQTFLSAQNEFYFLYREQDKQ